MDGDKNYCQMCYKDQKYTQIAKTEHLLKIIFNKLLLDVTPLACH